MAAVGDSCQFRRDSGGDAQVDDGDDASVSDAADDGGVPDADSCACTPLYQSFDAQAFCGCFYPGARSANRVCIPIPP